MAAGGTFQQYYGGYIQYPVGSPQNPGVTGINYQVAYGTTIPLSAGDRVVTGTMLWAGQIVIDYDPTLVPFPPPGGPIGGGPTGGGGGGGVAGGAGEGFGGFAVGWTHKVDCIFSLGYHLQPKNEIGIMQVRRIWLNNILIFDATDPLRSQIYTGVSFVLYPGTDDQTPDPKMLATLGADLSPSHKEMILLVFKGLPIQLVTADLSVPPIRVELQNAVSANNVETAFAAGGSGYTLNQDGILADWRSGELYLNDGSGASITMHKYDIAAQAETNTLAMSTDDSGATLDGFNRLQFQIAVDWDNVYSFVNEDISNNSSRIALYSLKNGSQISLWGGTNLPANASSPFPLDSGGFSHAVGVKAEYVSTTNMQSACVIQCKDSSLNHRALIAGDTVFGNIYIIPYTDEGAFFPSIIGDGTLENSQYYHMPSGQLKMMVSIDLINSAALQAVIGNTAVGLQDSMFLAIIDNTIWMFLAGMRDSVFVLFGGGVSAPILTFTNTVIGMIVSQKDLSLTVFTTDGTKTFMSRYQAFIQNNGSYLTTPPTDNFPLGLFYGNQINAPFQAGYNGYAPIWFSVITEQECPPLPANLGSYALFTQSDTTLETFGYFSGGGYAILNLEDGSAVTGHLSNSAFPFGPSGDFVWDSKSQSIFSSADPVAVTGTSGTVWQINVNQLAASAGTISDVLRWLALAAGYTADQIVIDPTLTDPVQGVIISKQYETGQLFSNLGGVYNFQFFETDGLLQFQRPQTGDGITPSLALTQDDLASIGEDNASDFECLMTKIPEPGSVTSVVIVDYIDPGQNFNEMTQQSTLSTGGGIVTGTQTLTYIVPIVMGAPEAYIRAVKATLLVDPLSATQQLRLPWKRLAVSPSDIITISLGGGYIYTIMLQNVTLNADWSISVDGLNYGIDQNTQITIPDEIDVGGNPQIQIIPGFSDSRPLVLDTPLLIPTADQGQDKAILLVGALSYGQPGWQSATVSYKIPGGNFISVQRSTHDVGYGFLLGQTAMPDTDDPWVIDSTSVLSIALKSLLPTDFATCSSSELLQGVNAALIGAPGRWEYIFFETATTVTPKQVQLSNIIRGERGTDAFCGLHKSGDLFILISSKSTTWRGIDVQNVIRPPTAQGEADVYTAVGAATQYSSVIETDTLVCNSLKPFAPSDILAAAGGGDIVLTWARRDRLAHDAWVTNPVPMSETAEKYDVEILDVTGVTVLRTATDLTSKTYTYTAANQTSDGWAAGVGTTITVRIYQKSGAVGRGLTHQQVIDIS